MKFRKCAICGKALSEAEFLATNSMTYANLIMCKKLWYSDFVKIACCMCVGLLKVCEKYGIEYVKKHIVSLGYYLEKELRMIIKNIIKFMGVIKNGETTE